MFSFNRGYILLIVFLLLAHAGLDFFLSHLAIYATMSNNLLIVMLYAFVKTFWKVKPVVAGVATLLLAFGLAMLPYLQLSDSSMIRSGFIAMAKNSFQATILPYATGILLALMSERAMRQAKNSPIHNNLH